MIARQRLEEADLPNQAVDAARWQALLSSAKMRILSSVHQPYTNPPPGSRYLLIELWSRSNIPTTHLAKQVLIDYADAIIAEETGACLEPGDAI